MVRRDEVWKGGALVRTYLEGVRGAIPLAAEQLDVMMRLIAGRGLPVRRFADLGCGDGILAGTILARYPDAEATLVDFSAPMLAQARTRLAGGGVCFVKADLYTPDWRAQVAARAPFDVVVSAYAIHHLPDARKRELYAEIFALLAPGGLFVNDEHVASGSAWGAARWDECVVDSAYAFHRAQGAERSRAQVADEYVHRADQDANILAPVTEQCAWLQAIGFVDVDCYFKLFELALFAGRKPGATSVRWR
jgi:tRNA (cmo5U34)-methyltransferase